MSEVLALDEMTRDIVIRRLSHEQVHIEEV